MSDDKTQLISRKRHYFYVLVFSIAAWLFIALSVGGFFPIKYIQLWECNCYEHYEYMNISFVLYAAGGLLSGLIFSYPLHRIMLVAYSKPSNLEVPFSWMACYGKSLIVLRLYTVLFIASGIYMLGDYLSHKYYILHPTLGLLSSRATGFHCAAKKGNVSTVENALRCGAKVDAGDQFGQTPLHYAIRAGQESVVKLLLDTGADVNLPASKDSQSTPLHIAIEHGSNKMIKMLISYGGDVNKSSKNGIPPLHSAIRERTSELISILIINGADVNAICRWGNTPLDYANTVRLQNRPNDAERILGIIKTLRSNGAMTEEELKNESSVKRQGSSVKEKKK